VRWIAQQMQFPAYVLEATTDIALAGGHLARFAMLWIENIHLTGTE